MNVEGPKTPTNETPAPTSAPNPPKKLKLSLNKPRFERVSDEDIPETCSDCVIALL